MRGLPRSIFHIPQNGSRRPDWKGSETPQQERGGLSLHAGSPAPLGPRVRAGGDGAWLPPAGGEQQVRVRAPLQQRRADSAPHPGTGCLSGSGVFLWRQRGDARRLQEEIAVPGPGACHLTAGSGRSRGSPGLGGPCGSVWGGFGSGEGAAGARAVGGEEGRRAGARRRGGGRGASAPGGPAGLTRRRAGPAGTRAAAGGAGGASVGPGPAPPGRAYRPGGPHLPAGRLGDGGGRSRLRVGSRLGGSRAELN